MKRRHFLAGAGAAAAALAWWARPQDRGAPHPEYFERLNQELKQHGPMRPALIIDLDRLERNIDRVVASVRQVPGRHYRVVEKSLPSVGLLDYVLKRAGTRRLMSFHQPFLNADARQWPDAELLLGKPMPVRAAARFYSEHRGDFAPERQLEWLVDSPARLGQYLALAQGQGLVLQINIEIDVGLHRGGVSRDEDLLAMLAILAANPQHLRLSGFMGYEPHITAVPRPLGTAEQLFAAAMGRYQHYVDLCRSAQPQLWSDSLTLNTAGSPTYKLHEAETLCNDISVGTGLLKPSHYDIPSLAEHEPAIFIATPVLKSTGPVMLPGLDEKSRLLSWWDVNQRETFFIYGGYWLADYASPPGLQFNALYGRSKNQEIVNASPAVALQVDDQIFLRPHITEAVLLQFGDLIAVRDGRIQEYWPVFPNA